VFSLDLSQVHGPLKYCIIYYREGGDGGNNGEGGDGGDVGDDEDGNETSTPEAQQDQIP